MSPEAGMLLVRLADGRVWTCDGLARACDLSIDMLPTLLDELRQLGAPLEPRMIPDSAALRWPLELLDTDRIRAAGLPPGLELSITPVSGSTNQDLSDDFGHRRARLAECQHGGRGRRGRSWLSPLAAGLWFSYGFEFGRGPGALGPLALVAGIAVAEALNDDRVRLKWPNDLLAEGRKLGGILVELKSAGTARTRAVIGIGINARLPEDRVQPDQPWIDLHGLRRDAGGAMPDNATNVSAIARNRLAARLLTALDAACMEFNGSGFEPFVSRWYALDALNGRPVDVRVDLNHVERGIARGIDASGALRLERDDGTIRTFNAGDVSVRPR